jgi:wyosine [tRNA(Phe)-imidazoG37] synthetase (radical SAM superfamily)
MGAAGVTDRFRGGRPVRIAPVPVGQCTYSCVYCRLGGAARPRTRPRPFRSADAVVSEVRQRVTWLERGGIRPRSLIFTHGGEPTLDSRLGSAIERLSAGAPEVVVMTNASLLWRPEVRSRLRAADRVVVKVDAVDAVAWRRLNRPVPQLRLARVLAGIERFRSDYGGRLDTRTTLVPGLNDSPAQLEGLAGFLGTLTPLMAFLVGTGGPESGPGGNGEGVLHRGSEVFRDLGLPLMQRPPCSTLEGERAQ